MKIYSVEMAIVATAYIKAENEAEAKEKARTLVGAGLYGDEVENDVEISGLSFDDPRLPEVSLSPAMTVHGFWKDGFIEEVEDLDDGTGKAAASG